MTATKINDRLSVSKQPELDSFKSFKEAGFTTLINNRPDGEDHDQPGTAAEQNAAKDAGLHYDHIPVTGPTITEADIRRFQAVLNESAGPVFAHCKGGTRSLTLFVLGEVLDGRMREDEIVPFGESHGYNLSGAVTWLQRNRP